jgi:hypothetical protein
VDFELAFGVLPKPNIMLHTLLNNQTRIMRRAFELILKGKTSRKEEGVGNKLKWEDRRSWKPFFIY